MRWEEGRSELERMIDRADLQRVPPSRDHAEMLLGQAGRHIESAKRTAESDPEGAYALLYDAARKGLTAVLENQGLRPTRQGGHIAVYEAVRAQLPSMDDELRPFDRMRRRRRDAEYPRGDAPDFTSEDVGDDVSKVEAILRIANGLLDEMSPF